MNLEIKHIDTFNFIKGLLDAYHRNTGAACYDEVDDILTQMDKVPATDDEGYFILNPWEQEYFKRFNGPIPDTFTAFLKTWEQDPVDMYREVTELTLKSNLTYDIKDWINWCIEQGVRG